MNAPLRRMTLLLIAALLLPFPAHAATQTLEFQSGFNFLGLTVTPQAPLTTESLFETGAVQAVFLFDGQSQSFVYQLRTGQTLFGQSRAITPGAGVIVRADGAASRQVEGDAFSPAALQLSAGFNFIGAPALQGAVGVKALMGAYGDIESVFRWDFATQGFAFVLRTPSQLFGADFTLVPGAAYFMKAAQGGQVALDPGQFPAKTLASIALSRTTDTMQAGATYNLAAVTATATYSDFSTAGVTTAWSVPGVQGSIAGSIFTPAQGVTTATLTASYTEGGITRTATLTLAIQQPAQATNPAARDLSFTAYTSKVLVAVNGSGAAEGSGASIGTVPASTVATPANFAPAIPFRPRMKDRPGSPGGIAPAGASGTRNPFPARAITTSTTSHDFVITPDGEGSPYTLAASRVYSGTRCLIFCETAHAGSVQQSVWNALGGAFDAPTTGIYDKMVNAFGAPSDLDGNGRIVILYYMMPAADDTAGYFYSVDMAGAGSGNNNTEMFYMNLNDGNDGIGDLGNPDGMNTIAHEFQHLINYARRVVMVNNGTHMDAWMNEGLSVSAEHIYQNAPLAYHMDAIRRDEQGLLRGGQSVSVWKQNGESYALSYTFFQYLKNQSSSGNALFKKFIDHASGEAAAIEAIMRTENPAFASVTVADLMALYRVANLVNGDGIHGYGAEKAGFDLRGGNHLIAPAANSTNRTLEPGGAIYLYPSAQDLTAFGSGVKRGAIEFVRINP